MFRVVVDNITDCMANPPPRATYHILKEFCLFALYKCPGVRPVGIGERICRAIAKLVKSAAGYQTKTV